MIEVPRDLNEPSDPGESPQEQDPKRTVIFDCATLEDPHQNPFSLWLTAALRNSGKTQKDLANHLGINDSAISKLKHGKRRFLADELHRISDYLGVAAPSFPADNEQRTPQRATNDADAKLARIRAVLQVTDEVERVRELHEQDQKLRQLLGLCEFHDIIKSVRFLYDYGREAFERQLGRKSSPS